MDCSEQCQSCVDACDSCALDVSFGGDPVIKAPAHQDPKPPEAKNFSQQLECFCPYNSNDQCLLAVRALPVLPCCLLIMLAMY